MIYKPKEYWEKRLSNQPNLKGAGYGTQDEIYNKYLYSLKASALDKILNKHSIIIKEKSILDVGCGPGFFVDYYNKKGAKKITGIDITKVSISMLKEKYPTYNFQVADIGDPNLHCFKETFDIINVFDVLYHITDDERFETAISNISRLCAGGHVLITDVFRKGEVVPAEHVHYRSLEMYKEILSKNNIEILDIFPMYYLMGRSFHLPAFVLNRISSIFYLADKSLQELKVPNGKNIKLLVGIKHECAEQNS